MDSSQVDTFTQNYRDALQSQYDASKAQIEQQKDTDYATIMGKANTAGVAYSNFPQRSKIQYTADTYLPNLQKSYSTYQTGLNSLRTNTAKYRNNIQQLEAAMADLNQGVYNKVSTY